MHEARMARHKDNAKDKAKDKARMAKAEHFTNTGCGSRQ